ncbi:SCO family protein [Mesorhizobium sp. Root172]|jgi:protein SCO1/2|uniref:SCO family protein n=1 Tax=Mesorhizobium sp. Root172 TaxID=1736481 RepID=UPI0009EBC3F9|nr:SCO family protein [Mesorhizobium sp. Root172]
MTTTETDGSHTAQRIGTIVAAACLLVVAVGVAAMLIWPRTVQTGETLSDTDLRGKPFAVVLGFTRCPEVCPTTLWEMSEAFKSLGSHADRLRMLFISVDPTRDTPEFLARYLQSFDRHITGLTGTEAEIAAVAKEYRIYYQKVPTDDGDYTMTHTASIFLMDAEGQFTGTISYGESMTMRLQKLRRLIGATA